MDRSLVGIRAASGHRRGFTLTEVIVSLGVVALLGSITFVAVQKSRETARRMQCQNHFHQMVTAVHSFESVHGKLPSPVGPPFRKKPVVQYSYLFSGHLSLLAHLDQPFIGSAFDWSSDPVRPKAEWSQLKEQPIPVFLCPSDMVERGVNLRLSTGGSVGVTDSLRPDSGAFSVSGGLPIASVTDGTSQTIALSERIKSDEDRSSFDLRDYWFTGAAVIGPVTAAQMVSLCSSLSSPPAAYDAYVGNDWSRGEFGNTWFNCLLTPNRGVPDCSANSWTAGATDPPSVGSTSGVHSARSEHPAGVNVAFLDGSVRFTADTVDAIVWLTLGTIAEGYSP